MKTRKFDDGWRIRVGDYDKNFCIALRYFNSNGYKHTKGFRIIIDLNTEKLINIFKFNHKIIHISI